MNHLRILPLIAVLSLASTGCQFLPNSQTPETSESQPTESNTTQPSTNKLPPEQTYELQVNRDQVWGMLRKVAFTDNTIVVTLEVTNGSRQAIELNAKDDMYLLDNLRPQNRYNLSPPPDNPTIAIEPGTTVKGDFVFIGRLSPKATELTLYINASTPTYSQENAQRPNMRFTDIFIRR